MIELGDTLLRLDYRNHLWIILSHPDSQGRRALANFTTHDPTDDRHRTCPLIITLGEHPWVKHDSCIYFDGVRLDTEDQIIAASTRGRLHRHEKATPDLVRKIQLAALESDLPTNAFKSAIRATLADD